LSYKKNIFQQSAGNISAQIIGIIAIPILARLYSPLDFGLMSKFTNFVYFCGILITLRYEYFIVATIDLLSSINLVKSIIFLGLITLSVFTFLIFIYNSQLIFYFNIVPFSTWIYFVPLVAFLISMSISFQHFTQRNEGYAHSSISEVLNKSCYVIFAIIIYKIQKDFYGLIIAVLLGYSAKLFYLVYVNRKIILSHFGSKIYIKESLLANRKGAYSFSLSNLIQSITGIIPVYTISLLFGLETLGQWSMAISILSLPTSMLGSAIGSVYFQKSFKIKSIKGNIDGIWIETIRFLLIIGLPIFIISFIAMPKVIPLILGSKWVACGEYSQILLLSIGVSFFSNPFDRTSYVFGIYWYPYVINLLRLLGSLMSYLIAIKYKIEIHEYLIIHSIQGGVFYLVDLFMSYYFIKKNYKVN